ncbi:unnamed protein product, partial [Heterosigma akashiwo]
AGHSSGQFKPRSMEDNAADGKKVICFDASKRETHHPNNGFKKLFRKLRSNYKVQVNKDELSMDWMKDINLLVLGGPRDQFSRPEVDTSDGGGLSFVFPYGASMSTQAPARPLLSSGPISFPLNRPVAAAWEAENRGGDEDENNSGGGRLVVVSSVEIFADEWLDKEENQPLMEVLLRW